MPSRQKYMLRLALAPTTAAEGVTYMDIKAVEEEVKRAREEYRDARLDFVNEDDSEVSVLVRAADIQLIMHSEWHKPLPQQVMPATQIPRPKVVQ